MKIVITSKGNSLDSDVDPRFGRTETFVVYDMESGAFEALDNTQNMNAVQGAGIQTAENISRLGAECVITGNCGPKAFRALHAAGVKVMLCSGGTVRSAVERFKAGDMKEAESANVDGHWK